MLRFSLSNFVWLGLIWILHHITLCGVQSKVHLRWSLHAASIDRLCKSHLSPSSKPGYSTTTPLQPPNRIWYADGLTLSWLDSLLFSLRIIATYKMVNLDWLSFLDEFMMPIHNCVGRHVAVRRWMLHPLISQVAVNTGSQSFIRTQEACLLCQQG